MIQYNKDSLSTNGTRHIHKFKKEKKKTPQPRSHTLYKNLPEMDRRLKYKTIKLLEKEEKNL